MLKRDLVCITYTDDGDALDLISEIRALAFGVFGGHCVLNLIVGCLISNFDNVYIQRTFTCMLPFHSHL